MPQPKKKPFAKLDSHDQETLKLLMANIGNLEYRMPGASMWIKHPYFQPLLSGNREGVMEVNRRFCEAIIQLLRKHERLK
jgi:hypothetical protein